MNNTIYTDINNCNKELDYFNLASYILNGVLVVATIYSELAGLSKCKSHNGIIDGATKLIDRTISKEFNAKKENSEIDLEKGSDSD